MSETSNYDCAVEVRDALHTLTQTVEASVREAAEFLGPREPAYCTRRNSFARELFAVMVMSELRDQRGPTLRVHQVEELAARAWEWADILDRSDPLVQVDDRPRIRREDEE